MGNDNTYKPIGIGTRKPPSTNNDRQQMTNIPYANVVGALMYAMICTRPDISYAVSMVSRYMHDPGKKHWMVVKWIIRYIQGTIDVGLKYSREDKLGHLSIGYVDFDYAKDLD